MDKGRELYQRLTNLEDTYGFMFDQDELKLDALIIKSDLAELEVNQTRYSPQEVEDILLDITGAVLSCEAHVHNILGIQDGFISA